VLSHLTTPAVAKIVYQDRCDALTVSVVVVVVVVVVSSNVYFPLQITVVG